MSGGGDLIVLTAVVDWSPAECYAPYRPRRYSFGDIKALPPGRVVPLLPVPDNRPGVKPEPGNRVYAKVTKGYPVEGGYGLEIVVDPRRPDGADLLEQMAGGFPLFALPTVAEGWLRFVAATPLATWPRGELKRSPLGLAPPLGGASPLPPRPRTPILDGPVPLAG
jgi:hypothetical protein